MALAVDLGWGVVPFAGLLGAVAMYCGLQRGGERGSDEQRRLENGLTRMAASGVFTLPAGAAKDAAEPLARIEAVAAELRRLREVAEGVHGVEALFGAGLRLEWISPSIERLTGRLPAECLAAGDFVDFLVHDSDRRYCQRAMQKVLESGQGEDFEMRFLHEQGKVCWVACRWRPLHLEDGSVAGLRLSAEDIQGRKEAEYKLLETVAQLRRAQALSENYLMRSNDERLRLSALLNVIRLGTLFMDRDHRVLYYNRAMLDIWRLSPGENLIGLRDVVLESKVVGLLESPEAYFDHIRQIVARQEVSAPFEIHLKDGRVLTEVSAVVEDSGHGRRGIGRVWIYEDVTEQRSIARKLVAMAERDPLTNLYNRRRFHEELERLLADAERRHVKVGLLAIDLDGFKPINDAFGHQAGDEVLVTLAREVGGIIRRNELFFRLGGDEFGVLVPDADEDDLIELAHRIVEGIGALRFVFGGRPAGLTASLGIAFYPDHACDGEALIAAADEAMYRSKREGRNRWSVAAAVQGESARMSIQAPGPAPDASPVLQVGESREPPTGEQ
ncbi:GGDEF domain-containing protein [Pseudothauera rhizosphaerae]|uniref:GGDEF domain-containing protein n=2 Tax=Pseudothauera rhizosphaerae TaxID=2565932 RepID=A0A4S4AMK1_9RHOO|nr:GGDEF domain-containing protein [Pseudothauera rhizosphaerae]